MTPEWHARVSEAFLAARALAGAEREAFLAELGACGAGLRAEVERLLRNDGSGSGGFLGTPLSPAEGVEAAESGCVGGVEVQSGKSRFRVVRGLGEGGSSAVYLAEQTAPVSRLVALKVLRTAPTRRESVARFEAERQAIALMQHPGIAALYDAGWTAQGRPFFAMEHVPGSPVTAWCRGRGAGMRRVLELFLELCAAVAHAHQKGVVHRDLKPSNILVTEGEDGRARVKVIDFGLAKSMGVRLHAASFATAHGQLVGTLAYMSPEQLAGDPRQIDVRTDVYALGAVLQEMLTGRPAVDLLGMDLPSAIRRVESGRREPLAAGTRRLAADLDLIIGKAMAAEASRRYQSVPELAADVERFVQQRPVLARRPGAVYVARKFAARNKAVTGAIAAAVVTLVVAGVSVWSARVEAERSYEKAKDAVLELVSASVRIADQVGSRGVRRDILRQTLAEMRAFAQQDPDDPKVLGGLARALGAVGDLEEEEGRREQAAPLLDEVLRLRQELARRSPGDPERRADLSIALVRVGNQLDPDAGGALAYYERALAIDEELAAAFPDVPRHLSNLAWSYDRIAGVLIKLGRLEVGERMVLRQLEVIGRPQAARPGNSDVARCVTTAKIRLGRLAQARGDAETFLRLAEEAWEWAQRGKRVEPGSVLATKTVAGASGTLADAREDVGDVRGALAMLREAAAALDVILRRDPNEAVAAEMYQATCERASRLAASMGEAEEEAAWAGRARAAPRAEGSGEGADDLVTEAVQAIVPRLAR